MGHIKRTYNVRRNKLTASGRRSKFEDTVAGWLDAEGITYQYEPWQLEYQEPLRKNLAECGDCGSSNLLRTGWYTPDFVLDSGLIIEAKGRFTAADRRKMLAVIEGHPDERIVMLFMRDNRIHRRSQTYYSDWCMERDIDYDIGQLKQEWLTYEQG
jgi:hypothetical protein